ncbi:DUF922 domain-containing protein [Flavisolibacter ginsenosidimutans]|uniref:DUF922 domain-containing protein n=1 Tax=Flavisolibacter ginsenosidimutans TaxID=661481 RepID=A0A5B8UJ33_9BACT|nr:DUF922 domain-containing protein [Flavisolibacter ginsenosidimutans]QEC56406.1 DUF922 domain-containing protein [Flavisolibacter ginsenosidimutans]
MKRFHLLPLLLLTANFSGTPAPAKPQLPVPVTVTVPEKILPGGEDENEVIPWQPERKLGWEDFLCAPQKQGDAVASTSTSLGISYQVKDGDLTFHISCHFSKKKSWGLLRTDYILAHEQVHFDITELHARKLYEALSNYQFNPETFKKDIAAIYEQIVKEKEDMQEAYDGETDHSRRKSIQYEWFDKVDKMLAQTAAYAAYP